jgi:hypothetical protein
MVAVTWLWLMFAHPWLMLALLLVCMGLIVWLLPKLWRGIARVIQGLSLPRPTAGTSP